jgi:hypothetical protein
MVNNLRCYDEVGNEIKIPEYLLADYAPFHFVCSSCGRKTWSKSDSNLLCLFPQQPNGIKCMGILRNSSRQQARLNKE